MSIDEASLLTSLEDLRAQLDAASPACSASELPELEQREADLFAAWVLGHAQLLALRRLQRRQALTTAGDRPKEGKEDSSCLSPPGEEAVRSEQASLLAAAAAAANPGAARLVTSRQSELRESVESALELQPEELALGGTESCVGRGTVGKVVLAEVKGKQVAVKLLFRQDLEPCSLQALKQEVDTHAKLLHPNVVYMMGACFQAPKMCIVSEYMSKGSLDVLVARKEISFRQKMLAARDVIHAMSWLHAKNIVHMDLKLSNVLVSESWEVKVADVAFCSLGGNLVSSRQEAEYASPELLLGLEAGPPTDVFSFGLLLWELITERVGCAWVNPEISSLDEMRLQVGQQGRRPRLPSKLPKSVKKLLTDCWETVPTDRPSFEDIAGQNLFEKLLRDKCILKSTQGRRLWFSFHLLEPRKPDRIVTVPWLEFQAGFLSYLRLQPSAVEWELILLKDMLQVEDEEEDSEPGMVSIQAYNKLLCWFGPLDKGMLKRMQQLAAEPWFYGHVPRNKSEQMVMASKHKQCWMLRFGGDVGNFTVTSMVDQRSSSPGGKLSIVHTRISHELGGGYKRRNGTTYACLRDLYTGKNEFPRKRALMQSPYQAMYKQWLRKNVTDITDNYVP